MVENKKLSINDITGDGIEYFGSHIVHSIY